MGFISKNKRKTVDQSKGVGKVKVVEGGPDGSLVHSWTRRNLLLSQNFDNEFYDVREVQMRGRKKILCCLNVAMITLMLVFLAAAGTFTVVAYSSLHATDLSDGSSHRDPIIDDAPPQDQGRLPLNPKDGQQANIDPSPPATTSPTSGPTKEYPEETFAISPRESISPSDAPKNIIPDSNPRVRRTPVPSRPDLTELPVSVTATVPSYRETIAPSSSPNRVDRLSSRPTTVQPASLSPSTDTQAAEESSNSPHVTFLSFQYRSTAPSDLTSESPTVENEQSLSDSPSIAPELPPSEPTLSPSSSSPTKLTSPVPSSVPSTTPTLPSNYPSLLPSKQRTPISSSPSPSAPPRVKALQTQRPSVPPTPSAEIDGGKSNDSPPSQNETSIDASAKTTTFYAIADVPYNKREERILPLQLQSLPGDAEFIVHLGDIKSADTPCTRPRFGRIDALLNESPAPMFLVVGDNEWTDCGRPDEAHQLWAKTFGKYDERHWTHNFNVKRQPRWEDSSFAFLHEDILFLGLTILGGDSKNDTAWDTRLKDQFFWTTKMIEAHTSKDEGDYDFSAIVMFGHAGNSRHHRDFFEPMATYFQDVVMKYSPDMPILYLMGNQHEWGVEYGFMDVPSWQRIQLLGGVDDPPLKVVVTPSNRGGDAFHVDRHSYDIVAKRAASGHQSWNSIPP